MPLNWYLNAIYSVDLIRRLNKKWFESYIFRTFKLIHMVTPINLTRDNLIFPQQNQHNICATHTELEQML